MYVLQGETNARPSATHTVAAGMGMPDKGLKLMSIHVM